MAYIDWSEALSVGFEEIDNDHMRLVGLVNGVHDALTREKGHEALLDVLDELLSYTGWHFRHEERLMQDFAYAGLFDHKEKHADLVRQATALYENLLAGDAAVPGELLFFLKNWLTDHITGTDKVLGQYLAEKAE